MKGPNCYDCIHRRQLAGDAHSKCVHPSIEETGGEALAMLAAIGGQRIGAWKALNVSGDPHGIRNGWFFWPANFDPAWLRTCDGFTPAEESTDFQKQHPVCGGDPLCGGCAGMGAN